MAKLLGYLTSRRLVTPVRASKESDLARVIDALVSPQARDDPDRAIELLERLAAAGLSRDAGPGRHTAPTRSWPGSAPAASCCPP